uniref:Sphingomyelin phosphodiesterase n=2 Tax=Cacopsylla melanoneura TaxID=428564 RepID=A0A8D9E2E7_9HEMI
MDSSPSSGTFKLSCIACQLLASLILTLPPGNPKDEVSNSALSLCVTFFGQPEKLCRGIIEGNLDVLFDLKEQGLPLNPDKICGTVLENANCSVKNGPQVEWSLEMDYGTKEDRISVRSESRAEAGEISIVQITDIHYDPEYEAGRTASCSEPLCCRNYQPNASSRADRATKYGHYNYCDMPLDVVRSALESIRKQKNISMVYMTGDLVSHAIWETSKKKNLKVINLVADLFREYLGDIPVIPIIGNHETHPVNVFAPYFIQGPTSTNWLYKEFIDSWGWSLPESARQTFLKGGYYSFVVKDTNLRIIVLNSNIYQKLNWWNVLYPIDMNDQLKWFTTTLMEAEQNEEKVHILSHIPPGSEDTMQVYQREYRKIVERFEHTITAEFNGHTHYEDFTLFYDKNNSSQAVGAAYNGGSITSYYNVNPNYRVYKVDKGTWELNDFDSYGFNISLIQDDMSPEWNKLYSFKEQYGLKSMRPEELNNLVIRMMDDSALFDKYFYNFFKGSNREQYDSKRKMKILCDIMTSEMADLTHCNQLKKVTSTKRRRSLTSIGEEFTKGLKRKR